MPTRKPCIFFIIILAIVVLISTQRVEAWNKPEPEVDETEAKESFFQYESNENDSAWNTFLNNAEDMANLTSFGDSDILEKVNDLRNLIDGSVDIFSFYDSPQEIAFLRDIDYDIRLLNQTPFSLFLPQILATVAMDYLNYHAEDINQLSASDLANYLYWKNRGKNPFYFVFNDSSDYEADQRRADEYIVHFIINNVMNKVPNDMNALKPNIYLYGEPGTKITISFAEEELLLKVLPEYKENWNVSITNENTLTVDGKEGYEYLFYESSTARSMMQTDFGFLLKPDNMRERLLWIMEQYGFNHKESTDFAMYWSKYLKDNKSYYVFPQTTEIVDQAMPLDVSTTHFDSYYRIWFYFCETEDVSVSPQQPEIKPVKHDGTSLIEWGVVM